MKIDVINNYQREISLLRSVGIGKASIVEKSTSTATDKKRKLKALEDPSVLERLSSLEAHLNLKLGKLNNMFCKMILISLLENSPNKQLSALERIQVIELKLLQLERTIPTWCGLNFNQPNREVNLILQLILTYLYNCSFLLHQHKIMYLVLKMVIL
jgi:hypothetical protein